MEAALSIMAASIPVLRALVRQGNSLPPPGYDYETGDSSAYLNGSVQTTMTTTRSALTRASFHLPVSVPAAARHGRGLPREQNPASRNVVTGEVAGKRDAWDDPDQMGYEMTSYLVEARPVDFTA